MDKYCVKGLLVRVLSSNAGAYIGTVDKEDGCPNCRCSGYYRNKEQAQEALNKGNFERICMDNQFCNGGLGCRVHEMPTPPPYTPSEDDLKELPW